MAPRETTADAARPPAFSERRSVSIADGSNARSHVEARAGVPSDLRDVTAGDVLCDRHRRECFLVLGIDSVGISLRQDRETFYVPHSLFAPWYGSRLFPIEATTTIPVPEWCASAFNDR